MNFVGKKYNNNNIKITRKNNKNLIRFENALKKVQSQQLEIKRYKRQETEDMKLLINNKYADVCFWSFMKMNILTTLTFNAIIIGIALGMGIVAGLLSFCFGLN